MIDDLLGLIGLSQKPNLPPVNAISDDDLERMWFAAMQRGDKERASRVRTVQAMRRPPAEPLLTEAMQSEREQRPRQAWGGQLNPMNRLNDVLGQQQ